MIDDAVITTKIKQALATSERVSALDINVTTHNGLVTLRGQVDTPDQRAAAEELAHAVEGVRKVQNELEIRAVQMGGEREEFAAPRRR